MSETWANSTDGGNVDPWDSVARRVGADLFLDLQPDPGVQSRGRSSRRRHALAAALREAIATGRLTPGTALPPYRSLAADLGLARGTVSSVYSELVAEGWLTARRGSGTRVADGVTAPPAPRATETARAPFLGTAVRHDFALGQPNTGLFPRTAWINATRDALSGAPDDVFAPGHPQGRPELRRVLAGYLARARGVHASADEIVLMTGVQGSLELLSHNVFGDRVAVESYGLPFHRMAIERGGTEVVPVAVDHHGLIVDELTRLDVSAVVLTPSHQFPTGVALHPERRAQLIAWARHTGALIVEDDYDGEFRYDRSPVGALQALGPDVVIYAGSVSKSLSPAVRIGWLVLPTRLVDTVAWAKGVREPDASLLDQLVLAQMITSGAYDRHIRRSRQFYRRRTDALTARLATIGIEVPGVAAGLHTVIPVAADTESALVARAHEQGIAIAGLDFFRHPGSPRLPDGGLVVGFGTPSASSFGADLDALAALFYLPNRRLRAE